MRVRSFIYSVVFLLCCGVLPMHAEQRPYTCELGLQAGVGYYVGDATRHIFSNPREAYGLIFRYKFNQRWAIQTKASGQRITGKDKIWQIPPAADDKWWVTQAVSLDVMAEFNFFRFGDKNENDSRIKPWTPYIFIGVGGSMFVRRARLATDEKKIDKRGKEIEYTIINASGYIPLGIGLKWKFSKHCGLNIAWQHNLYFTDNIEAMWALNNTHKLNGWNWLNCDLTGQLTVGVVVEFMPQKKVCNFCDE